MAEATGQTVPNVPYKAPLTDQNGYLSQAWSGFFRQLFTRIGGPVAPTNLELADSSGVDLTVIESNISGLQSSVVTIQNDINGLKQGRAL